MLLSVSMEYFLSVNNRYHVNVFHFGVKSELSDYQSDFS